VGTGIGWTGRLSKKLMNLSYLRRSFLVLSLALIASACGGDDPPPTAPTTPPPQGPATLQIVDVTVGTGLEASAGKLVATHYVLYLYDPNGSEGRGVRIQASRDGGQTYDFRLGRNATIPGYEQGILGMRIGGSRRVTVPPSLAYGSSPNGSIPGNSWLVFEIDLIGVAD
jgi:FKBP-type peptidyl-prolyl cis-trans isomerase